MAMYIRCNAPVTSANPEMLTGIGISQPSNGLGSVTPPWENPGSNPFIHLRIRRDTMKWRLVFTNGDGNPDIDIALTGVEDPVLALGQVAQLDWDPTIPRLRAWVNGVLGADITDPDTLPRLDQNVNYAVGPCYFQSSGSVSNAYSVAYFGPFFIQTFDVAGP